MTKPVLAIARLVASCATVFSQTAGTNSIGVLTLAEAKFDQPPFAKRLQKAQYIPKIGAQFLYISPFTSQGLPQNVTSTEIPLKWDCQPLSSYGSRRSGHTTCGHTVWPCLTHRFLPLLVDA